MSGQGGNYSGLGVFNRVRAERDKALEHAQYWEKRAREAQDAAYNSGVWAGAVGTCCAGAIVAAVAMFIFA